MTKDIVLRILFNFNTASDLFSGHGYSGNDGFSGTKPLDDAILFTNSGITALVELFLENFDVDLSKVKILKLTKIPKTLFFSSKAKSSLKPRSKSFGSPNSCHQSQY